MLRSFLLAFAFVGLASNAHAALVWKEGLTIKSVEYAWNGTREVIIVQVNESLTTGCAASDANRQLAYIETAVNEALKIRYSALVAAMTANKKVALLYQNSPCDSIYGARLEGVRIIN